MAFSGIATYDPGAPPGEEIAEDVSAIVSLISRTDTPLLDLLGTAPNPAFSTHHEWLDESLVINRTLTTASGASGAVTAGVTTGEGQYFRAGDLIKMSRVNATASASSASEEVMLVTAVATDTLTVTRGYGGTTAVIFALGDEVQRVGRAALEGADSPGSASKNRTRRSNWTQIFTEDVVISGTRQAARNLGGIGNEHDHQVANRMKEILAALEQAVVNGIKPASTAQGSSTVRRTMDGLIPQITGVSIDGSGYSSGITEAGLNLAFRTAWDKGAENVDLILVNAYQKRAINSFIASSRRFSPMDTAQREVVGTYESDFGVAKIMLSRWVPRDTLLGLDTSKINIMPLTGRSFFEKPLAETGDFKKSQIVGNRRLQEKPDRRRVHPRNTEWTGRRSL
jgi:hypothetical protein